LFFITNYNSRIFINKVTAEENMKLSLIVPCYNEEEGINNLQNQLDPILEKLSKSWELELIFVDDGSKDNTYDLLQQHFGQRKYTRILKHEVNQNLGAAMRTGFSTATGDVIVTMDSDCTYDPKEIFPMLDMLKDDISVVTASPYHPLGGVENVPKYRLFLSKSITLIYRILTGSKIHTFTALFRAQRKEAVKDVNFTSNDFLATAELLIHALTNGQKVVEYPTVLHVRVFGSSKIKLLKVIWSHTKFIPKVIKMRWNGSFSQNKLIQN